MLKRKMNHKKLSIQKFTGIARNNYNDKFFKK